MLSQLLRGRASEASPIVLDRRRIYILPTRQALMLGMMLTAMLIGSINYGLSLGYVLTFLIAGIAMAAMLHTWRNLQGIRIEDGGTTPAFAGEEAGFHLKLAAPNPRLALQLRWQKQHPVRFDIDEAGEQRVTVHIPAPKRGRLQPGRLVLFTVYPLGLFRAWSYVDFGQTAIVYPKPADSSAAFSLAGKTGNAVRNSPREGSEDFAGLRAWQPGDSPRQIAWKVAARSDELATKRFIDSEGDVVTLDWAHLGDLATESRLSLLARQVLEAERLNLRYALRLPGQEIGPGNGTPHRNRCLEALALFET